jgi:DNA invertase Pin-like site-specific DNA recombinase
MSRLKSAIELEVERQAIARYALGKEVQLDRTRLLYIYCRQSTDRQYFKSAKNATEQRLDLEDLARNELQWPVDKIIVMVENDTKHKHGFTSGTKSIQQRPKLNQIFEDVKAGKVGACLVVDVSRLSRDEDLIDPTVFAKECKKADTIIITTIDAHMYDFNHPKRDDLKKFMDEAYIAAQFIKRQVRDKMLKARSKKAENGLLGSGTAPIGLMRDETGDNLKPRPEHAPQVNWLYKRFRELNACLSDLLRELIGMKDRGIPLFPLVDGIDEKTIQATRVEVGGKLVGWTIASRSGLISALSNPQYQGHMVFEGRVVKRDAFPAIVDEYAWWWCFEHLAQFNLDGQPFERGPKTVRYSYPESKLTALMGGVRHDGRPVIDGVSGAHVYCTLVTGDKQFYTLVHNNGRVNAFETGVSVPELDRILEANMLECLLVEDIIRNIPEATPKVTQEDTTLATINAEIARKERAIRVASDTMDDNELRETYASLARLRTRRDEEEQAQQHKARTQAELEQAREDCRTAHCQWGSWDLARRRRLIHLITDQITLEELSEGWLRFTVYWNMLVGGGVEHCYIWRSSGSMWSDNELDTLREQYATSTRNELLHTFPKRSWLAIIRKATRISLVGVPIADSDLPVDVSLSDVAIFNEYMLEPGKRIQWVTDQARNYDERT